MWSIVPWNRLSVTRRANHCVQAVFHLLFILNIILHPSLKFRAIFDMAIMNTFLLFKDSKEYVRVTPPRSNIGHFIGKNKIPFWSVVSNLLKCACEFAPQYEFKCKSQSLKRTSTSWNRSHGHMTLKALAFSMIDCNSHTVTIIESFKIRTYRNYYKAFLVRFDASIKQLQASEEDKASIL